MSYTGLTGENLLEAVATNDLGMALVFSSGTGFVTRNLEQLGTYGILPIPDCGLRNSYFLNNQSVKNGIDSNSYL